MLCIVSLEYLRLVVAVFFNQKWQACKNLLTHLIPIVFFYNPEIWFQGLKKYSSMKQVKRYFFVDSFLSVKPFWIFKCETLFNLKCGNLLNIKCGTLLKYILLIHLFPNTPFFILYSETWFASLSPIDKINIMAR